jgi:predicted amidophosphoribosyltransferase
MGLVDLLLPQRCVACRAEGSPLCPSCRELLQPVRTPLCDRCGAPVAWPVPRCAECAGRRIAFAKARAGVLYEGPAVDLVRGWKEEGRRGLAGSAAGIVLEALDRPEAAAITFVPPDRDRELWRGHNPARALARELAATWGLPLLDCLVRAPGSIRQRTLTSRDRSRNVTAAFRGTRQVSGRIVLVDDVYTTGATVSAAATELMRGGARCVEVVTFARTPRLRVRIRARGVR